MEQIRIHYGYKKDEKLNLEKVREDLDNDRIMPLKLQRNIVDRRYKNDLRRPYPLSVHEVAFYDDSDPNSEYYPCSVLDDFEKNTVIERRRPSSSNSHKKRRLRYFSRIVWT